MQRSRPLRLLIGLLLASVLGISCAGRGTELVVLIDSDYLIPTELQQRLVTVTNPDSGHHVTQQFAVATAGMDGGPTRFALPLSFALVPCGNASTERVTISLSVVDRNGMTHGALRHRPGELRAPCPRRVAQDSGALRTVAWAARADWGAFACLSMDPAQCSPAGATLTPAPAAACAVTASPPAGQPYVRSSRTERRPLVASRKR